MSKINITFYFITFLLVSNGIKIEKIAIVMNVL